MPTSTIPQRVRHDWLVLGQTQETDLARLRGRGNANRRRVGQAGCLPLVKHVYEMFDGTIGIRRIERSFGHSADMPAVQDWIDRLLAEEWADEDGY